MEYASAILFALVQAVTEFVPVSSSGHLVLLHAGIPLATADDLAFDVLLHAGTLLATVLYFRFDIYAIIAAVARQLAGGGMDAEARLGWLVVLASIPAALAGLLFADSIAVTLRSPWVVVTMLVVVGIALLAIERFARGGGEATSVTWRSALGIGCAQALALIPGTSRSGITIIAGMAGGLRREAAVRFSFLMSVPIIFGATAKEFPAIVAGGVNAPMAVGFAVTVVAGWIVIHYLLRYVRNHSLAIFAYYRFALAAVVAVWLLW